MTARQIRAVAFWLRDRAGSLKVERATRIGVQFAANDEPVYHFSVEELIADDAATAQLWVKSIDGRTVYQTRVALEPRAPRSIWADFPAGSEAAYLEILLSADSSRSVTARLTDLRVLGQRPELRAFVVGRLTFPKHR